MAITKPYDPAKPAGTDQINLGDDQIRDDKTAIQERMQNGGHAWPTETVAPGVTGGVHYPHPSAKDAGEWDVYDASGGLPDFGIKRIQVIAGGDTVISAPVGTVVLSPTASVGGNTIVTDGNAAVWITFSVVGCGDSGSYRPMLSQLPIKLPSAMADGSRIIEAGIFSDRDISSLVFTLRKASTAWTSKQLTTQPSSSPTTLATLTVAAGGRYGIYIDDATEFVGSTYPTVDHNDVLYFEASGGLGSKEVQAYFIVETSLSVTHIAP